MEKPIYANNLHKITIENYLTLIKEFVREISNDKKFDNFLHVYDTIIEYHNGYGKNVKHNNWYDWMMVIPVNMSVMVNGYLAGIETKRNQNKINSYKILLNEILQDVVNKIEKIQPINE